MKTLICLCLVLSVAAVTRGMNPFGDMMKMGMDGMKQGMDQMMNMFPMMGKDAGPFGDMMDQMKGMAEQAGGPEKMLELFEQTMGQMTEQSQDIMQPFMEQMGGLMSQGATPDKYKDMMKMMEKAAKKGGK